MKSTIRSATYEAIGMLSMILLAMCGIPLLLESYSKGFVPVSMTFLLVWYLGEIGGLVYAIEKHQRVRIIPFLFNYGLNVIILTILVWWKLNG